jgi:hypothetical protein
MTKQGNVAFLLRKEEHGEARAAPEALMPDGAAIRPRPEPLHLRFAGRYDGTQGQSITSDARPVGTETEMSIVGWITSSG